MRFRVTAGVAEQSGAGAEHAGKRHLELAREPGERCLAEHAQRPGIHPGQATGDRVDLIQRLVALPRAPQTS